MISAVVPGNDSAVSVTGGYPGLPGVSPDHTNPFQGVLRTIDNSIQVFDRGTWRILPQRSAIVDLNDETKAVIDWSRQQMHREAEVRELAKKHPIIADLQERLDVMLTLLRD